MSQTLRKDHLWPPRLLSSVPRLGCMLVLFLEGEEDDETDAASSLMIMALGAEKGDKVTVKSDNAEAVEKIAALIEQDLDAQ